MIKKLLNVTSPRALKIVGVNANNYNTQLYSKNNNHQNKIINASIS